MNPEGNKATVFELFDELVRSWWTVVAGVAIGLAGALVALHYSPKVYSATSMIRIAPAQISEELLRSTVTEDMARRLLAVQDAILSRPYMEKLIAATFGALEDEIELQAQIDRLRSRVIVATDRRAGMFRLTYNDSDARLAARVVNTLTDLYIEANAEFRENQSGDTVDTFDRLVANARAQFEAVEREINTYRGAHPFETEQYLDFNQREKEARTAELESNRSQQQLLGERLRSLRDQMTKTDWTVETDDGTAVDPLSRRIREARNELARLRALYFEKHPDVRTAQAQLDELIAQARSRAAASGSDADPAIPLDPAQSALQDEIDGIDRELSVLVAAEDRLQREIQDIRRRIRVTPDVQRSLTELQNRYDVAQRKLLDLQGKREEASDSHFLEQSDKGERLEVLERAIVPLKPVSPQPPRVYAVGLAAGLLIFVGPLLLRRVMNPVVKSEAGLRAATEIPVLVSIPRVITEATAGIGRRRLLKNVSLSVVASVVLAGVRYTLG